MLTKGATTAAHPGVAARAADRPDGRLLLVDDDGSGASAGFTDYSAVYTSR